MVSPRSCKFFTNQFQRNYFLVKTDEAYKLGSAECGSCQIIYIVYRLLWALWWIGVFIHDVIDEPDRHLFMIYLTNWSYMAVGLSSIFQLIAAVYGAVNAKQVSSDGSLPPLYGANWVLYSFASASNIMVSILYWVIIYDGGDQIFTNYATHAVNAGYVITDMFITGIPLRILHFWMPMLFGISYAVFSMVYWAVSDDVIYDALDYEDNLGTALAYVAMSLVVTPVVHFLLFFLYWVRILIYDSCSCCSDDQSDNDFGDFHNPNFEAGTKYATTIQMS